MALSAFAGTARFSHLPGAWENPSRRVATAVFVVATFLGTRYLLAALTNAVAGGSWAEPVLLLRGLGDELRTDLTPDSLLPQPPCGVRAPRPPLPATRRKGRRPPRTMPTTKGRWNNRTAERTAPQPQVSDRPGSGCVASQWKPTEVGGAQATG